MGLPTSRGNVPNNTPGNMGHLEPLPRGANFVRAKMLWEIGLDVAGDPDIPYGGNRDMCIVVGSGGQADYRPSLKMASGSAIMAHDVVKGGIDMAFCNPSALITQAYRGVGMFDKKLPVRIVCSYPSWDRFAIVVHPRTGLKSVGDIKAKKFPLKMSVREDPTHSTLVLVEQIFNHHGFGIKDVLSWGGEMVTTGSPMGPKRMDPIKAGTVDAVLDEALVVWYGEALGAGYQNMIIEADCLKAMVDLGWRKVTIKDGDYPNAKGSYDCLDFSGWPIYCRESLDEKVVIDVCEALIARQNEIPWTQGDYHGIRQIFGDSEETPIDVPLHPGVEKFLRDNKL
jgi:TRAP-type uncharacterized transport system substrate-binding protein